MGVIERVRQWVQIGKVRPVVEAPGVVAGRGGELALLELIGASYRLGDAEVLAGRRIPSARQGRRREVDLIVCTPRVIHLIEAKNWSGRLEVVGGRWRQTRRGGDVVDHGDLLADHRLRRDAVVEYLGGLGVDLDDRFIRDHIAAEVVFTNPRLELDPDVEALPEVVSCRELDGYLGGARRRGLAGRVAAALVASCRDREAKLLGGPSPPGPIPRDRYRAIVAALAEVGTWDRLEFHGTRSLAGDLVSLRLGGRTYRRAELVDRAAGRPIRLRWTRNRAWGLLKAITGLGTLGRLELGKEHLELSPADTALFHAVGEREPAARRLVELDRIVLG